MTFEMYEHKSCNFNCAPQKLKKGNAVWSFLNIDGAKQRLQTAFAHPILAEWQKRLEPKN